MKDPSKIIVGVLIFLGAVALYIALNYWVANWIWHPLGVCTGPNCKGYQFWSGIGSDLGQVTLITGVILGYRKINCHTKGCPRIGHFNVDGTPYKVCRFHHPHVPENITAAHIDEIHTIKMAYARGHIEVDEMEKRLADAFQREEKNGSVSPQE